MIKSLYNFSNKLYLTESPSGSDVVGYAHVTTAEVSSGLAVMVASSGCEQLMDGGLFAVRLRAFF
jgi:hypothetical protein